MIKKVSIICYRIQNGEPLFFVGKRPNSNVWQYPTGHVDPGETELETVPREVGEELSVYSLRNLINLNEKFRFNIDERGEIEESVFAVELSDEEIKLEDVEFSQFKMLPLREAQELCSFKSHKKYLAKAYKVIKEKSYGKILIFCGPSGSGKDTVINNILEKRKDVVRSKTYTTRPCNRKDDGKGRIGVTESEFTALDQSGQLIEKNLFNGYWYGTSKKDIYDILLSGQNIIMDIDLHGMMFFKKHFSIVVSIFFEVDLEHFVDRIIDRKTHTKKDIEGRLKIAKEEIANKSLCDYSVYNKYGELDRTIENVNKILKKELN